MCFSHDWAWFFALYTYLRCILIATKKPTVIFLTFHRNFFYTLPHALGVQNHLCKKHRNWIHRGFQLLHLPFSTLLFYRRVTLRRSRGCILHVTTSHSSIWKFIMSTLRRRLNWKRFVWHSTWREGELYYEIWCELSRIRTHWRIHCRQEGNVRFSRNLEGNSVPKDLLTLSFRRMMHLGFQIRHGLFHL
jgi:hypothetical protein